MGKRRENTVSRTRNPENSDQIRMIRMQLFLHDKYSPGKKIASGK